MADFSLAGMTANFGGSGGAELFGDSPTSYSDTPTITAESGTGGGGYFSASGALQSAASLLNGYLGRRLDIDIASKVQGSGTLPTLRTTQNSVLVQGAGIPQSGGVNVIGQAPNGQTVLNLSTLLPFLIVGGLVWAATHMGGK